MARAVASVGWSQGLPPGAQLGRYTILERIAAGGMAELYLARQRGVDGFEKLVAIKRVLPHLAEDPEFVEMFRNEARLAATLDHPNIALVFDVGIERGEHYYALEYVHGRNLLQVLKSSAEHPLSIADALTVVIAIASALHHAHEQTGPDGKRMGIVHRDVTPSNVMIAYSGAVKLTDFGIARAAERTSTTRAGTIKGKAGYMSPEQARGEIIDRRSDVFSLGVVLYELSTGVRAFYASNDYAMIAKIARGDYRPPRELRADYPDALEQIIGKALAVDPDDRYESAEAVQVALEELARAQALRLSTVSLAHHMKALFGAPPLPSTDVVPLPEPTIRGRRRVSWLVPAGVGVTLLVAGVGLGAAVFGGPAASPPTPVDASGSAIERSVPEPPAPPREVPAPEPAVGAERPAPEPAPIATEAAVEPPRATEKRRRPPSGPKRREAAEPKASDREAMYPPGYSP